MDNANAVSPITTYGGWAVVILLGFVAYQKYFAKNNAGPLLAKQPSRQPRPTDPALAGDVKKKVEKTEKTEKAVKPKPKSKPPVAPSKEVTPSTVNYNDWQDNEAADRKADREFARQLSHAHSGTKFNAKKSDEKRQKSVKQSRAEEGLNVPVEKPSAPSSHAGDADDDLSPPTSPATGPTNGQDVSDMLEPSAPGPSVLRLTDTDAVKPKERKTKQPAEVVETKKQRQNRKKAEAAKASREEAEKVRKVQLEQQRRTARIAEGRAAKDGSTFGANQKNAWDQKPTNGDSVQPLDTFEKQRPQPKAESAKSAPAKDKKQENADPWLSGVPSEEEQMEMLRQEESWNEVKTKKKGKKKDPALEASANPVALTNGTNGASAATNNKTLAPSVGSTKRPIITSSSSSFAALTPEETDDNDDVEKEWDV